MNPSRAADGLVFTRAPALVVAVAVGVHGTMKLPLNERDDEAGPSDAVVRGVGLERHNKLSGTVEEESGR